MKVNLIYDLPEEQEEYETAMNGGRYKAALEEFSNYLRGKIKHENVKSIKIEEVREKFYEIINDLDVRLF